jgi:dipeptidyl aminopeptidase/acylaminoacyl peptidase
MRILLSALALSILPALTAAQTLTRDPPPEIVPRKWLVIAPVDERGRRPFRPDAVFVRHLLLRDAAPPEKGEKLSGDLGKEAAWEERDAKEDGTLEGEIGYAYTAIDSPTQRVMLAELSGAAQLFVNGVGFVGDLYGYGFGGVPIELAKGRNGLYVTGIRGGFKLRLTTPNDPIVFGSWDATLADLIDDKDRTVAWMDAAVLLMNASTGTTRCSLAAEGEDASFDFRSTVSTLESLCLAKPSMNIRANRRMPAKIDKDSLPLRITYRSGDTPERTLKGSLEIAVRSPRSARRVTFHSNVDGSVQQCSILPPSDWPRKISRNPKPQKVVLSLHGAGVDSFAQVTCYSQRSDFLIIAPTNRRPFGFDWQDWGRLNAFEALEMGARWMHLGETQVYLTGHSMGGHGTWHLAANHPDRFVAIAPSAGWASFDTYGGRPKGALSDMWHSADAASDTLALISNLKSIPAYILHGTADDNVPVTEAHKMEEALIAAGAKPSTHYQEGAGHWWDGDASPGVDCVDWPGIFDLFRTAPIPKTPTEIDFTTVDPGVDAVDHWIELLQPLRYGERLHVKASYDEATSRLVVATQNVRRFRLISSFPWPLRACEIDGRELSCELPSCFLRSADEWTQDKVTSKLPDSFWAELQGGSSLGEKTPGLSGPFKRAFDHDFALVYGSHGTAEENRELFERARSDLEVWWYRANGTPALMSDETFRTRYPSLGRVQRNVILYGNADTNTAWTWLLGEDNPIQVRRSSLKLGGREWKGDDLGAVFVRPLRVENPPRNGAGCLVGAFADTGVRGARLGYTLAPFVSGVGYPDYALFSADVLAQGDGGVLAAGWFDYAWKLDGHGYVRPESTVEERKH